MNHKEEAIKRVEEWKPVEKNKNYLVSNLGNVKSIDRFKVSKSNGVTKIYGKHLKAKNGSSGYLIVALSLSGKTKSYLIHRLVAQAFIPNLENKKCINHINGIKTDNRVENLEWCSYKENMNHAIKTNLYVPPAFNRKDMSFPIIQLSKNGEFIYEFPSINEAARAMKTYESNICRAVNGGGFRKVKGVKTWVKCLSAKGYVWKLKQNLIEVKKEIELL